MRHLAWYAELLLEMNLKILLRKTGARLNFKIALKSLHIDPAIKLSQEVVVVISIPVLILNH
jgi:hypothetical protein